MELPTGLIEKPKKLFSIELWLAVLICALWIDAYSRIDQSFSFVNVSLDSWLKFVVSSGIIVALLHWFCLLIHLPMVMIVFIPKLNLDKLFFSETKYPDSDRLVRRDDLLRFAIEKNNDVAMQIFKDFMKSENNRELIAKMWAYFFFFLNINFFAEGVSRELITSFSLVTELDFVPLMKMLFPLAFLYCNFKYQSSGTNAFIFVPVEIKELMTRKR